MKPRCLLRIHLFNTHRCKHHINYKTRSFSSNRFYANMTVIQDSAFICTHTPRGRKTITFIMSSMQDAEALMLH